VRAHSSELAVSGHRVGLPDGVGVEAVLAPQPAEPPAHGVTDDAHAGRGPQKARQSEDLRLGDHVAPQHAGLYPGGVRLGIDAHAPHARGVDQDTAVAGRGDAVAGCQHSHAEPPLASEANGGYDVGRAFGHHHQRRVLVRVQVESLSPLVVALLGRRVRGTPQATPESFERRTVDDRLHGGLLLFRFSARTQEAYTPK
jgi:hypothetical protein